MKKEKIFIILGVLMMLIGGILIFLTIKNNSITKFKQDTVSHLASPDQQNTSKNDPENTSENEKNDLNEDQKTADSGENPVITQPSSDAKIPQNKPSEDVSDTQNDQLNTDAVQPSSEMAIVDEPTLFEDINNDAYLNKLDKTQYGDALNILHTPMEEIVPLYGQEYATRFQIPSKDKEGFLYTFEKYLNVKSLLVDTFYPTEDGSNHSYTLTYLLPEQYESTGLYKEGYDMYELCWIKSYPNN